MPSAGGLVLLFGGSFDPVHRGHVELSRAAAVSLAGRSGRSVVRWFIPAHRSPHKAEATMFDGPARAELLRIALAGEDDAIVWTDELDRHSTALVRGHEPAQSYSIDTATRARAALDIAGRTDVGLRWLMGADQALALHRWKDAHRLVAIAPPVILRRIAAPGVAGVAQAAPVSLDDDVRALSDELRATGAWTDAELAVLREGVIDTPWIDVSSTTIRRWLANAGAHRDELRASLPPGVLARLMSGV
jgi:nicotinate (nicotinamide) nucleotide adenylyltransferase